MLFFKYRANCIKNLGLQRHLLVANRTSAPTDLIVMKVFPSNWLMYWCTDFGRCKKCLQILIFIYDLKKVVFVITANWSVAHVSFFEVMNQGWLLFMCSEKDKICLNANFALLWEYFVVYFLKSESAPFAICFFLWDSKLNRAGLGDTLLGIAKKFG